MNDWTRDWTYDWIRRQERRRSQDPAFGIDDCSRLASLQACQRLQSTPGLSGLRLSALRGRCAEETLVRRMCGAGFGVSNQVVSTRGASASRRVLDLTALPPVAPVAPVAPGRLGRRLPHGIESKHVNAAAYLRHGAAGEAELARRVHAHLAQVQRQMADARRSTATPGTPRRVQLWYSIGGTHSAAEYARVRRLMAAAAAQWNRRQPARSRVTVRSHRVAF